MNAIVFQETNPCFTCNSINDSQVQTIKMNTIKLDSRYTTNQQIYKLVATHSINKIHIKLNDIKKTKMVQTLNVYYNNKSVQSVIELKNRPNVWLKAKQVRLQANQVDVKIDLSLPIVASNLMFEYAEFYENQSHLNIEQLQCPRCSATVNSHPGVCNNCGENVFQCHKCRAINYDERDPFLCNSCGFCKFAKFDISLVAKQCYDIEIIENEDDRKKCLATVNSLLDKSDRLYKNLMVCMKPTLETQLTKFKEQSANEKLMNVNLHSAEASSANPSASTTGIRPSSTPAPASQGTAHVNKAIPQIAQKYAVECKSTFDELAKTIQKLILCRKELREYDKQFVTVEQQQKHLKQAKAIDQSTYSRCQFAANDCFGCAYACVDHCVVLLRSVLAASASLSSEICNGIKNELCKNAIIEELINFSLKSTLNLTWLQNGNATTTSAPIATATGSQPPPTTSPVFQQRSAAVSNCKDIANLIYLLVKDNSNCTKRLSRCILDSVDKYLVQVPLAGSALEADIKHEMLLLSTFVQRQDDSCWEQRLKLILKVIIRSINSDNFNSTVVEAITAPCLRILNYICKNSTANIVNTVTMATSASYLTKKSPQKSDVLMRYLSEPGELGLADG
jgi:E3 ubiquitin-protein ligase UBR4